MLSVSSKKIKSISQEFIKNPEQINHLDVSNNQLRNGKEFAKFPNLKTLIVDSNQFTSLQDFPKIETLDTFSANYNQFTSLDDFIEDCRNQFPNLRNLSLLKNPIAPFFFPEEPYHQYRVRLVQSMPGLQTLDGLQVDLNWIKQGEEVRKQVEQEKTTTKNEEQFKNEDEQEDDGQGGDVMAKGTIEYNAQYSKVSARTIQSRSQGNRFVQNQDL